jgi:hypothetical protein
VALSEACTNVLQHGDPAAGYEVGLYLDAERCRLRVIEVGRGAAGGRRPEAARPGAGWCGRAWVGVAGAAGADGPGRVPAAAGGGLGGVAGKRLTYTGTERSKVAPGESSPHGRRQPTLGGS